MVAGNQGEAEQKAWDNLQKDPQNQALKTEHATKLAQLNQSLRNAGQRELTR